MATARQVLVPGVMKAIRIARYGGSEQLKYEETPLPQIGADHVLAKVRYAGVNPVDWKIREGNLEQVFPVSFPLTLGHDVAGEIVNVGGDSGRFRVGERVLGFGEGSYAEFTAAAIKDIAVIPEKIDFAVAAALPTAGLTALQAIRCVQPKPGTRILIHGAAGAVGSFAIQIAKIWGAQTIGTASDEDIMYLRSLGHVQVVDYKHERFETVGQVDAVLDLIGGETAARSYAVVKKGGVTVSTVGAANAELAARAGIRGANVVMKRSAADLSELAGLVERGDVKPRMGQVFRLDQAREAQDTSQQGRPKGKILLRVGLAARTMRAAAISEYGPPNVVHLTDLPVPEPGTGQLRVRVRAAGVGPWDALVREGRSAVPQALPLILGSDIAGTVDAIGAASHFRMGDAVYGLTNEHFTGGYSEYALASASSMAQKPKSLSFIEAASAPVIAVTAWQMLFDYAHAVAGQKVLIHGAAGNVGAYAVQMARNARLEVFATAASDDLDYIRKLGADVAIDYRRMRFEDAVPKVDIVLDTVGGDTRMRSIQVLKPGGALVSSVSTPMPSDLAARAGVKAIFFVVDVTTALLDKITELFDGKKLVPNVGTVLPLADARVAHEMLAGAPHKRGKIVLNVAA